MKGDKMNLVIMIFWKEQFHFDTNTIGPILTYSDLKFRYYGFHPISSDMTIVHN